MIPVAEGNPRLRELKVVLVLESGGPCASRRRKSQIEGIESRLLRLGTLANGGMSQKEIPD